MDVYMQYPHESLFNGPLSFDSRATRPDVQPYLGEVRNYGRGTGKESKDRERYRTSIRKSFLDGSDDQCRRNRNWIANDLCYDVRR